MTKLIYNECMLFNKFKACYLLATLKETLKATLKETTAEAKL